MTKSFERFLHAFSDDELVAFAQDRSLAQPPYWKVMRLALRIEATRRGLALDVVGPPQESGLEVPGDAKSLGATDVNLDGKIDFLITVNNDDPQIFLNRIESRKRLRFGHAGEFEAFEDGSKTGFDFGHR